MLGLLDSSYGYDEHDPNADLFGLLESVSEISDSLIPRFIISTNCIEDVKKLLSKKTSIPFRGCSGACILELLSG